MKIKSGRKVRASLRSICVMVSLLGWALVPTLAAGQKSLDQRIRDVKTIMIREAPGEQSGLFEERKGEWAELATGLLQKEGCFQVSADKDTADAILELRSETLAKMMTGGQFALWFSGASVTSKLTDNKSGDLIWSAQQRKDSGRRGLSPDQLKALKKSLVEKLIGQLNKVGCKCKK